MGIEWFRDLSIAILGFVTTALLIFTAILVFRLYRMIKSTLLAVKATSKIVCDAVHLVQGGPFSTILALIQGIRRGFECFNKKFRKENS